MGRIPLGNGVSSRGRPLGRFSSSRMSKRRNFGRSSSYKKGYSNKKAKVTFLARSSSARMATGNSYPRSAPASRRYGGRLAGHFAGLSTGSFYQPFSGYVSALNTNPAPLSAMSEVLVRDSSHRIGQYGMSGLGRGTSRRFPATAGSPSSYQRVFVPHRPGRRFSGNSSRF